MLPRRVLDPRHVISCDMVPPIFQVAPSRTILETTQGQIDGFFSQLPFECYLSELVPVGY